MKKISLAILAGTLIFSSCDKDDDAEPDDSKRVSVNISGLEDLGSDYVYEGWVIVNGSPVSTGVFTVDGSGNLSKTSFDISDDDAANATKFVLSIEPTVDTDPAPSDVKLLGGDITSNTATLSVEGTIGDDFTSVAGSYILATPTDGNSNMNENSGVWFLDPNAGPGASLTLPTLPTGWVYEGWAVINGTPVSTGTFTSVSGSDNSAPFSGTTAGPAFPGEDFLMNTPSGLTFPTDLSEQKIVISVEPQPDNSTAPFLLKPLLGTVPMNATDHTSYSLGQNLSTLPTGSITIQ